MIDGDSSEIISALDTIYDTHAVSVLLDLLDGHRVEIYICLVSVKAVLILKEGIGIFIWNAEDVLSVVSWNDLMSILRIKILQVLKRCSGEFAHLFEMKHLIDVECVDMLRGLDSNRTDAVLLIIIHGVEGSDEGRDISSCFSRKIWPQIPESPASASSDSLVDVACSAVV